MTLGVALGILVPALVFGSLVLKDRYARELSLRIREPMSQYTQLLSSALAMPIWNVDKAVASQLIDSVMRNPDVVAVTIHDEFGNTFVSGEDGARRHGLVLSQQSDILMEKKRIGQVQVELSTDRIERQLWADFTQLGLALLAQVVISFALVLLLVERRVIRPLSVLQLATSRLARGELNQPLAWHRRDEIGSLAHSLDQMRESLGGLIAERDTKNSDLQHELNDRLRAEQALRFTQAKFKAIFHASPLAMTVSRNAPGYPIVDINDAGLHQFGLLRDDLLGASQTQLWCRPQDQTDVLSVIERSGHIKGFEAWLRCGATLQDRRRNAVAEGALALLPAERADAILCEVSGRMVDLGTEQLFILVLEDITERKRSAEMIWNQANFDRLTGLPNRHMFQTRLEQDMAAAARESRSLALVFFDLDLFKEVNDTLGHEMGDLLLQEAARRLRVGVRQNDLVARLGGDEFTLILSGLADIADVHQIVQEALRRLAEPFVLAGQQVHISTSAGITFYPQDATGVEALLKNADQAMYAAKSQGRNRYSVFTPSMQDVAQKRMRLINDLRVAIAEHQFSVFYQPIVDLKTGQIRKAEALVRWRHPVDGMVSPADFVPVAEETGMIVDIGNWVFQQAVKQVTQWRKTHHPDFQVSVNVSPVQFRNEGINQATWLAQLSAAGLPGQAVLIEITEGLLMDAGGNVTEQLRGFRQAGIGLSLDDFGTGYSSLSYLKKFDIDVLKIDQAFVRNLTADSDDMALCNVIIVMAHTLGLKVVAEGVETQEQCDLLAAAGCDYGQGYLFARPALAADMPLNLAWESAPADL
ncbi:diguanylate cyclase (GGDEF)-like protein [Rhodoferax ferrireducens]|uniref:Diguanylate cyclase (GGDEF)-like protein n=1 Tax=Rhodoferax ferrireducens TaxID=192843 RepID=A0ABU2C9D4_9BURK|nr:EAL domain-containing protein [Rhodoferax ferrireducens]MDR7377949.1 diguanylate cyclase (GGDEF)-like protein [Rhodoferax ferrireducens]